MTVYSLETHNLTKIYRRLENRIEGIEDVSLKVEQGNILALLGPNGAGKSTFIKAVTSVLRPDSGEILIDGKSILTAKKLKKIKRHVGYAPEMPYFYTKLTGLEFASFVAKVYECDLDEGGELSFVQLSKRFGLERHLSKLVNTYSQGMLRKTVLCFAIAFGKRLIILDEPSNGLDPDSYLVLRDILHDCKTQNRAVLLSTHQLFIAQEVADKIAICKDGHIHSFVHRGQSVEELYKKIVHHSDLEV